MNSVRYSIGAFLFMLLILTAGCSRSVEVPVTGVTDSSEAPAIHPDYTAIVFPPNIAPMNFEIRIPGEEYIAELKAADGSSMAVGGQTVKWDMDSWRQFIGDNAGRDVTLNVYVKDANGAWTRYSSVNHVAPDSIDSHFSYRLIEPSYTMYGLLTVNQRDLTSFDESVIFNNTYNRDETRGYCINCHVPRNQYRDGKSQFHLRQFNGGTYIMDGKNVRRVNLKTDSTISAGVYQAWHPTDPNLIAYSVNDTHQQFFLKDNQKIEVLDSSSDVILYDMEASEVSPVANDTTLLETFPAWSPDGERIFYSVARYPEGTDKSNVEHKFDQIRYDIVSRRFNREDKTFSEPDTVVYASGRSRSALLPRISPDGRYLLFCEADHGTFHIWHKDSDLFVTDLESGETEPLAEANSDNVDSYHSWSSNGRWIIFSSRRDDGSYTRPYITYFSPEGKSAKAFIVPQEDPGYYHRLMKSYNVPEFMVSAVQPSRADILKAIESEPETVTYRP
ncbi:MAG: hypothetical protein NC127_07315 [Muribaculum sp.]|nr:hypothetical protein [Muribaculum sp.]